MLYEHEWPENTIKYMTPGIIKTAKDWRSNSCIPMVPSGDPEAHVRFKEGTSRHCVFGDRKSDATDIFVLDNKRAAGAWNSALSMPEIGGLGIYFDSSSGRVMFHIDNRPYRLMWICPSRDRRKKEREYIYFRENSPSQFLETLAREFKLVTA